jgi:Tol biopolymer transport system component
MKSRRLLLAALLLAAAPAVATAQYFGQNKVQYKAFDFQILRTEHFDVHFYPEERAAAYDAARMAERSYARLSRILNHRFRERKTIILYASHTDFSQTNTAGGEVGEGTGGFTDFFKQRNVMPLTGSYRDIEHVLAHEMTHQFQLDVFARGRGGSAVTAILAVQPPLWFMEGMAEYLSLGPTTPETAMWLRDAALEDKLPTIEQLMLDGRIFPYRYGHALWTYIGERWGDEAVGTILQGSVTAGIEGAVRRTLGLTFAQLSAQWHDAIRRQYLPEVGERVRARAVAQPTLTTEKSTGTYHLAPAISPDGTRLAYFGEGTGFSVDLWLATVGGAGPGRRLFESTISSNYETYRFINSAAAFSPDGTQLAFAAKRGGRDELVLLDVARNKVVNRISIPLNGITTPAWSPDGKQLVFTGYDGGLSDLFLVNADGTGFTRLTDDKHADLHPAWSPDGTTIAFTSDRGPETDFDLLRFSNYRIALLDVATKQVRTLPGQDVGKHINPVWSPDGQALAFVSDRNGVSNIYLYDLAAAEMHRLTDFFTGVQGITPLSPVLSWAPKADRLAFVYYEGAEYDIYTLEQPRRFKGEPVRVGETPKAVAATPTPALPAPKPSRDAGQSFYRGPGGLRPAAAPGVGAPGRAPEPEPVSVAAILDSTTLSLPDTSEFQLVPYKVRYSADYVQRPTVGFVRDNFGNGIFGGTSVTLSDDLGDHNLVFGGFINGRIDEAQVVAQYVNLKKRLNWAVAATQSPIFFVEAPSIRAGFPSPTENTFVRSYRRFVIRGVQVLGSYPVSKFQRMEFGVGGNWLNDSRLSFLEPYDPRTGFPTRLPAVEREGLRNLYYASPSAAWVYDNSLFGYVGPLAGRRIRFEAQTNVGSWNFTQFTIDHRRYDRLVGPFTFATRALGLIRHGRDANQFQVFAGNPELIRGHTSGSYFNNECLAGFDANTQTGCVQLDRLVGSSLAIFNAELRFPIIAPGRNATRVFPPLEGVFFFDAGLAFSDGQTVKLSRSPGDDPINVRTPVKAFGAGIRSNLLGFVVLRLDYARSLDRSQVKSLWTVTLGPTF